MQYSLGRVNVRALEINLSILFLKIVVQIPFILVLGLQLLHTLNIVKKVLEALGTRVIFIPFDVMPKSIFWRRKF